jgi:uncharacterized protein involved in exopolysaccharide biosynthesis
VNVNDETYLEDEISLVHYIKILVKRKGIVLVVFLACVIPTAVVSSIMPEIYEATASLMILPSKIQSGLSATRVSLDAQASPNQDRRSRRQSRPTISIRTHKALVKSNTVLERIINKLKLTDRSGVKLTPDDISGALGIEEAKPSEETNILQLKAEDDDPRVAKEKANAWAQEYIEFSRQLIMGEVKGTGDFVSDQFEIAKQNLIQAEEKVKDFQDENKIDIMEAEVAIRKGKLNDYRKELIELEIALKTKADSLRELQRKIQEQDKFVVSKAITDDALWQREDKQRNLDDLDKRKLRSEEVNPIYQSLESRIVNTEIELNTLRPRIEYLRKSLRVTEEQIGELERTANQKKFDLAQLRRQVDIYRRTYDNLSAKIEEARIAKAMELGEVKLVSPAVEPRYPIKPKKGLNLATSALVGLALGMLAAVLKEFWEKATYAETQRKE